MKKFMNNVDSRIRTAPKSVSEMYKWGMISFPVYEQTKHMPLETAIAMIEEKVGWQTYTVHADQIIEYCTNWKDYPGKYEKNDWIRHCLKLCGGKINFESCLHAYYHFV